MPAPAIRISSRYGQMIWFAVAIGGDYKFSGTRYIKVTKQLNTVRKIAASRGYENQTKRILRMNNIRHSGMANIYNPKGKYKKRKRKRIKVPDRLRDESNFHVLAGDSPPTIVSGYPKIESIERSGRAPMTVFAGYDSVVMRVPVRFEAEGEGTGNFNTYVDGSGIEKNIAELDRMCGRGKGFKGAAVGPPAVVRVTTVDEEGTTIPLIPTGYQPEGEDNAPLWWISAIDWDEDPVRNGQGERIRQLATIDLTQYVPPRHLVKSAAARRAERKDPNKKAKAKPKGKTKKLKYEWANGSMHTRPEKKH